MEPPYTMLHPRYQFPPPLEWPGTSSPPLVDTVLIAPGCWVARQPWRWSRSNSCDGLFFFIQDRRGQNSTLSNQLSSVLKHRAAADCPEVSDAVNVGSCPWKTTYVDGLRYSPNTTALIDNLVMREFVSGPSEKSEYNDWLTADTRQLMTESPAVRRVRELFEALKQISLKHLMLLTPLAEVTPW